MTRRIALAIVSHLIYRSATTRPTDGIIIARTADEKAALLATLRRNASI